MTTTATFSETYRVPEHNLEPLRERLARLNRRATKLGTTPITLDVSGPVEEERRKTRRPDGITTERVIRWVPITVAGEAPGLAGWGFVAAIHREEGGVLLATVPGAPEVPLAFRDEERAGDCDHCGHARYRRTTYVVRHEDTGAWQRVGSTCIKDFLGHGDPHAVARWAEALSAFRTEVVSAEDPEWGMSWGRAEYRWPLDTFLSWTASVIRHEGWVSRTEARNSYDGGEATVDRVLYLMDGPGAGAPLAVRQKWQEDRRNLDPTEADTAAAEAALAWAEAEWLSADEGRLSDYERNMAVALAGESVGRRTVGLAGSLLAAHRRHLGDIERKKADAARRGTAAPAPAGRHEVEVTVMKVDVRHNDYGSREVMTVQADAGWRAWGTVPSTLAGEVNVGDRVAFRATFKASREDETFAFFSRPSNAHALQGA